MIRVFSFLRRDCNSGNLTFRFVIPERYRPIFGKREIKRSLQTTDRRVAIPLAMQYHAEIQLKIQRITGGDMRGSNIKDRDGGEMKKITADEIDFRAGTVRGLVVDCDGDAEKETALMKTLKEILAQQGVSPSNHVPDALQIVSHVEGAKLSEICHKYCAEKELEGAWGSKKTMTSHADMHNLLIQIIGDVEISTVSRAQARNFKDILLRLPANMDKKAFFRGKTVKQILALNPEPQCIKTAIDKITKVSSLFGWAHKEGYCMVNPFEGLKPSCVFH